LIVILVVVMIVIAAPRRWYNDLNNPCGGRKALMTAAQASSVRFIAWLDDWYARLPAVSLEDAVIAPAGGASGVGVMVVDLLVGFCSEGALASPRVGALGPKAATFLTAAREAGIRHVLTPMDAHPEDSPEFQAFPPHCIAGTREADPIPELTRLPFFREMVPLPKRSINAGQERALDDWLDAHREVRSWIVIGDCTDLCVYQAAMHLRLRANARGEDRQVWVPADLVDTYDLPVEAAVRIGAMPHDAELMHRLFLYHMALNGVSVVRGIRA
jgi:nicotinamidase-related amidase